MKKSFNRLSYMKKVLQLHTAILSGLVACACLPAHAQSFEYADSLKAATLSQMQEMVHEFNLYVADAYEEYRLYEEKAKAEYAAYVNAVKAEWGGVEYKESSQYEWVEYGEDFRSRSVVDFDKGTALIQIKISPEEYSDSTEVNARLAAALDRLLGSRGSSCPYSSEVDDSVPLTVNPVMDGLVDFQKYDFSAASQNAAKEAVTTSSRPVPPSPSVKSRKLSDISASNAAKESSTSKSRKKEESEKGTMASRAIADRKKSETDAKASTAEEAPAKAGVATKADTVAVVVASSPKQVSAPDENGNRTVSISMELVSANLSASAAVYKDLVAEFAEVYDIEPALIFAVMEQESRFNPEAASWVPAYGLMQLVPVSGGVAAYKFVYGKEWVPTRSYLFVPRNNIELGTAYLRMLMNLFSSVKNPDCRRLCVIASYNTGAGNVSRAFTGSNRLASALPLIQEYEYDRLYKHLTENLSTSEARNYVSGVTSRRAKYLKKQ